MCFPMLRTRHGDIRRREVQVVFSEIIFENFPLLIRPTRANLDETKQMPSRLPLLLHLAFHRPDQLKRQPNNDRGDETLVPESKTLLSGGWRSLWHRKSSSWCNYIANNDDASENCGRENVSIEKRMDPRIALENVMRYLERKRKSPEHVKCLMIFQQNRTNRNFI